MRDLGEVGRDVLGVGPAAHAGLEPRAGAEALPEVDDLVHRPGRAVLLGLRGVEADVQVREDPVLGAAHHRVAADGRVARRLRALVEHVEQVVADAQRPVGHRLRQPGAATGLEGLAGGAEGVLVEVEDVRRGLALRGLPGRGGCAHHDDPAVDARRELHRGAGDGDRADGRGAARRVRVATATEERAADDDREDPHHQDADDQGRP